MLGILSPSVTNNTHYHLSLSINNVFVIRHLPLSYCLFSSPLILLVVISHCHGSLNNVILLLLAVTDTPLLLAELVASLVTLPPLA